MKTRLFLSVLLVFVVAFFLFIKPKAKENNIQLAPGFDTTFRIGVFHDGIVGNNYTNIKDLGLNLWHLYSPINAGWTGIGVAGDIRESTDGGLYTGKVKEKIDSNFSNGFVTILDRCKINYLTVAKRSTYECEADTMHYKDKDYWFYGYWGHGQNTSHDTLDNSTFGGGVYVRHSSPSLGHVAGYVDSALKSNREQLWIREDTLKYLTIYILPRIRIDTNIYLNSDTTRVCRIEIVDFYNNVVKSFILKAINFRQFYGINNERYHGEYVNRFFNDSSYIYEHKTIDSLAVINPDHGWIDYENCRVDYRVYWYGECEMWIDNITVENEIAYNFFGDNPIKTRYNTFQDWLDWEVENIAMQKQNQIFDFYYDEPEFCSLPALAKINREIKSRTNANIRVVPIIQNYMLKAHIPNFKYRDFTNQELKKFVFDSLDINIYNFDNYPLTGMPDSCSKVPTTLTTHSYDPPNGFLATPVTIPEYELWLQNYLDNNPTPYMGKSFVGSMKQACELGRSYNISFFPGIQTHSNYNYDGQLKEPSNEEIALMTNLSLSYSAKGLIYAVYMGYGSFPSLIYSRGLVDDIYNTPRLTNVYGQAKWDSTKSLISKVKKWGPYLINFSNANTYSYIYRNEKTQLTSNTFIQGIKTYNPAVGITQSDTSINNLSYDQQSETYLQVAVFDKYTPDQFVKYFMLVNRRCSPCINNQSTNNIGGRRIVTINLSGLSSFNNWKLYDLESGALIKTFDKNNTEVNLGNFQPGEGKLYKLVPVMKAGGIFVCDEYVSCIVNCDSTVFNNGYDLTINNGSRINFSNIGKIVMVGGGFYSGLIPTSPLYVEFKGNGGYWEGISLTECTEIQIDNNVFNDVGSSGTQTEVSALSLQNCFDYYINNSTFNLTTASDGVDILYNNNGDPTWGDAVVYNCTFNLSHGSPSGISVISVGSLVTPIRIGNNKFLNTSSENPTAIMLDDVTGGVLQSNFINNFKESIIAMSSTMDFYNNTIYSNKTESKGIYGVSGSYLNLSPSSLYFTGGSNKITTPFEKSNNINVEGSYFELDEGENIFNTTLNYADSLKPYHLFGYFNTEEQELVYATKNCFQIDSVNGQNPRQDVRWSEGGNPVSFQFTEYSCINEEQEDFIVFTYPGCLNDTVYLKGGGEGGAFNEQLPRHGEHNVQFIKAVKAFYNFPVSAFDLMRVINAIPNSEQTIIYKAVCDSININLRKRNYNTVEDICKFLLTNYPDSIKSIDLIAKLYYTTLSLDSNGNKINPLKTFYETLILNNQGNQSLINRTFYFIQKCKVILKQYQSAMQGFNTIMQQNPYSYEGLVASWDYAATYLLDSLNGHGGGLSNEQFSGYGENNNQLEEQNYVNSELIIDRIFNTLDTTKFSKQDRKVIVTNVNDAMKTSKQKQIEKVDALQKKSISGNNEAKKQLNVLKTINETVKPKKPNTVFELKKVISGDIKKVFKKTDVEEKGKQNILPLTYNLSQNYPNPFNPVTKINYELQKDGMVKLVIYDILGREIKTLLNELKQAGKYTVEFNGNNYASGVYFYKILVEEGKSFSAVKKMVMIK